MAQSQTRIGQGSSGQSSSSTGVGEKVQDLAQQASDQVSQVGEKAQEQVKGQVDTRSTQLGEQIGSTADDLRSVAEELRNKDRQQPAKLADQAADRAERFADYLKRSDGNTILRDVEDFGRKQPWAIVAGGMALGFLASRFLKSSSASRYRSAGSSRKGLEYDGPVRSSDVATATHVPPVDETMLPAGTGTASSVSGAGGSTIPGDVGGEGPIGAGPGGTRISAPPTTS